MSRIYTVVFDNVSVSAAQDLFYVAPADDRPVKIRGLKLSQVGTADYGDAQEEGLRLAIVRGHDTVGSGGTNPTARPCDPGDAAAGFTARVNDTTIASGGTALYIEYLGWNVRLSPWETWWPDTEFAPKATQAAGVTLQVRLLAAPADAITVSGTLYVEEE